MTATSHGAPLEQSCQRPGLWLIEGYTVERRTRAGRVRWWVSRQDVDGARWHVAVVPDLGQARDRIRELLAR